jgi:hypothetical protein
VVDYPPEECEQIRGAGEEKPSIEADLHAGRPTSTDERIQRSRAAAAATCTTSRCAASPALRTSTVRRRRKHSAIRAATRLPIGVGFGIRDAESRDARRADGRRRGDRQPHHPGDRGRRADQAVARVKAFLQPIREALGRMSWLQKLLPPKIQRTGSAREDRPEGLWTKCAACDAVLYSTDLEKNLNVCPKCGHHERLGARPRLDALLDPDGRFEIGSRCCRWTRSSSRTRAAIPSASPRRRSRPPESTRWW